jgi:predicted amidohydrolase YtcJ
MPFEPDLLLVNANVLTMDPERPRARAVAVAGGRITGIYSDKPDTTARDILDLKGATLIPGFHDAHSHMIGFGLTLRETDLHVSSLDELYARVTQRARSTPAGDWVVGSGYDVNKIGGHPDRDVLDRIAPGRRVWLKHTSGHVCVVNTMVLNDLGIDVSAPHVTGGRVAADPAGRPTGVLEERAQELLGELTQPYPVTALTRAIASANERYLRAGITSVTEAGIGDGQAGHSPVELAAYQAARDQGRLQVRVELMVASEALHELAAHPGDDLDFGLDLGIRSGFGDDWLRLGPVKIFVDGSLTDGTAALSAPYGPGQGTTGYLQADADELTATIVAAHRAGWRVAARALGDRAIDVALDSFAAAAKAYPRPDARPRVELFAVARPDQVMRAARYGVIAVPQGRSGGELGDWLVAAVGPRRASWLYRQRSLLDAGMVLPGSSECSTAEGAPLLAVHEMVNRRTASGAPFNPAEAVTAAGALRACTWGSAFASKQEHVKGSIEPGKLADLTVLSEDPTAVSPGRIGGLEVLATLVGGELRYGVRLPERRHHLGGEQLRRLADLVERHVAEGELDRDVVDAADVAVVRHPVAGARRVACVEVPGRVNALVGVRRQDRRMREVVPLPQRLEIRHEPGERPVGDLHRLLAGRRHHDGPGDPERRQAGLSAAQRRPFRPVGVGQRPHGRRRHQRHHRHAEPRAPQRLFQGPRPVPQRHGVLHRLGHHRRVRDVVVLPVEVDGVRAGQARPQHRERLVEALLRLFPWHAVEAGLDRRDAAPDAEVEPPAGELVQRARLLDHAHRVVQRQDRDQRAEPDDRRALRRRGQHQVRRRGDPERSAVVLGHVVGVIAQPLVLPD